MSIHDGHRQRLRQRFLEEGLDRFTEIQALELLLFYCIPRKDTNPIAHALLDRFGTMAQVLEAPVTELTKVPGISENAAAFLHLMMDVARYYQVSKASQVTILNTPQQCADYMVPKFFGRQVETVFLLCLDAKCKLLCCKEVGQGDVNMAHLSIRKVVDMSISSNATSVMLGHNHPSGLAVPSEADLLVTRRLAAALRMVDITLFDHIIVGEDDYVSLADSGFRFDEPTMI